MPVGGNMKIRLAALCTGLQFRFIMLICGLAISLIAAQVYTDVAMRMHRSSEVADAPSTISQSDLHNGKIQVSEALLADGKPLGPVLAELRNPGADETLVSIFVSRLLIAAPILVAGILLCIGLTAQVTLPLRMLANHAKAVADGDLSAEVKITGPRELRQVTGAFNSMIGAFKGNIDKIYELAYVDRITQLPNREYFRNELSRAISRAARANVSGALLFVDLDGFKKVNDTLGHDLGDKLLATFAERMSKVVRVDDTISWQAAADLEHRSSDEASREKQVLARLGGDEFTILLGEIREETDAAQVARRIIAATSEPFNIGGKEIRLGASVGIATFPRDGANYAEVLKSADMAMYLAKDEGKNTFRFFSEELNESASRRMEIETELRTAIEKNQLELYYQPKVDCGTGRPVSLEALLRWLHPEKGMVQPGEFIKIAEESGLIIPLGDWVLRQACSYIRKLDDAGLRFPVAVNISTQQFDQADFADTVLEIVRESGIDASRMEIEITESMAMSNPERALEQFRKLKRARIRIAIDDFGTGYSNLSHLNRLPFDVFKIDRSFVKAISDKDDSHGRAIVRTILAMARSLDYQTVAEGVETEEQQRFLAELGCTFAQGFLFAKPMPADATFAWLAKGMAEQEIKVGRAAGAKSSRAA
jgi:predicted signal transduction protein with EAL and GGDEF domain/HAMP domain-containing protein